MNIAAKIAATFLPADFLDEGRAARTAAQRHLASLTPERRAQLERDWLAAEAEVDAVTRPVFAAQSHLASLSAERRAELNSEWEQR